MKSELTLTETIIGLVALGAVVYTAICLISFFYPWLAILPARLFDWSYDFITRQGWRY